MNIGASLIQRVEADLQGANGIVNPHGAILGLTSYQVVYSLLYSTPLYNTPHRGI